MSQVSSLLSEARALFETPPPAVSPADAAWAALTFYRLEGSVKRLSGERDCNFLISPGDGRPQVLKFINDAEPDAEAEMQAAALDHLIRETDGVMVPQGLRTRSGERLFRATLPSGLPVRGRGYSYLSGDSALAHGVTDATRRSVGQTAARIGKALKDFQHPAAARLNLWDLCHVGDLAGLTADLAPSAVTDLIGVFLDHFNRVTKPSLGTLRRQVIHNDLSRSNLVVRAELPEQISGVLDFGDMIEAPLLCELAVAASYQLSGDDPLAALRVVVSGFVEITPLEPVETRLLLDFVLARLVGRILISEWRAKQFPANRDYILRSNGQARTLMETLMPIWRTAEDRDWQDFFCGEGRLR